MAKRTGPTTEKLLQKLIIVQLGLAGVPQHQIRKVVGVGLSEVIAIVKLLKRKDSK
jgi:hypothetical protein